MNGNDKVFYTTGENDYLSLQVVGIKGADKISFSNENEWCGDTETGFGALVSIDLNRNQVADLINTLQEWLKS